MPTQNVQDFPLTWTPKSTMAASCLKVAINAVTNFLLGSVGMFVIKSHLYNCSVSVSEHGTVFEYIKCTTIYGYKLIWLTVLSMATWTKIGKFHSCPIWNFKSICISIFYDKHLHCRQKRHTVAKNKTHSEDTAAERNSCQPIFSVMMLTSLWLVKMITSSVLCPSARAVFPFPVTRKRIENMDSIDLIL